MTQPLLELKDVSKRFSLGRKKQIFALNQLNLTVNRGEILGLVGESGCGKSTLARVVMGVYPPTTGQVYYDGKPLRLNRHSQRKAFALHAQMIFQDPYQSLDPHMTVESIVEENLDIHWKQSPQVRQERIFELLEMTGLSGAQASRYPHEFSGGQRQRIGIARALAVKPELILCDEPISALDISVRSQIINLLVELKESMDLTYLFISHDLHVVRHISNRIAVMYAGSIVELGQAHSVYENPLHPYTQMLLRAVLRPMPDRERLEEENRDTEDTTSDRQPEAGCPFASRCPAARTVCRQIRPELREIAPLHSVACHGMNGEAPYTP